jgi:hypothetical protein
MNYNSLGPINSAVCVIYKHKETMQVKYMKGEIQEDPYIYIYKSILDLFTIWKGISDTYNKMHAPSSRNVFALFYSWCN